MLIRQLGVKPYSDVWQEMRNFTSARNANTIDELWLTEHPPVYTQGQAGKAEHILNPTNIEIIQTDRGGQVTYHGPGQLVAYVLMDLHKNKLGIKSMICKLEQALINLLATYNIKASRKEKAPGVYVDGNKIASIGLRVKNGCTYHGVALNVAMDLTPFSGINPCGYKELKMTQILDFDPTVNIKNANHRFIEQFLKVFNVTEN
ncbi:MAG: octanoyltransferase [Legionellales bacterium RIFCSPHIGHO2_12_FULL_35_11]|nr:MAG: octanoyltransferase [Legionellales bacterium RIFCSPHIGHO2_12_FULL_35_11]